MLSVPDTHYQACLSVRARAPIRDVPMLHLENPGCPEDRGPQGGCSFLAHRREGSESGSQTDPAPQATSRLGDTVDTAKPRANVDGESGVKGSQE